LGKINSGGGGDLKKMKREESVGSTVALTPRQVKKHNGEDRR